MPPETVASPDRGIDELRSGLAGVANAWRKDRDQDAERRTPNLGLHDILPTLVESGWSEAAAPLLDPEDSDLGWRSLGIWDAVGEVGALGPWPFAVGFVVPLAAALARNAVVDAVPTPGLTCPLPGIDTWQPPPTEPYTLLVPWWEGVRKVLLPVTHRGEPRLALVDPRDLTNGLLVRRGIHHSMMLAEISVQPGELKSATTISAAVWRPAYAAALSIFDSVLDARAVGAGRRSLELTLLHAASRKQFGRPIGGFQAVKHRIASMATRVRAAELLADKALTLAGQHNDASRRVQLSSRHFVHEAALSACADAIHVHGGTGVTWEAELHLLYRSVAESGLCLRPAAESLHQLQALILRDRRK